MDGKSMENIMPHWDIILEDYGNLLAVEHGIVQMMDLTPVEVSRLFLIIAGHFIMDITALSLMEMDSNQVG